jgi:hypothetical protein
MAKINWRHVGRAATRVVGAAAGAVGGFFAGGGVGAIPGAAAGWSLGGTVGDSAMPDLPKQIIKKNYASFNIGNSYNPNAKDSPVNKSSYTIEQGQGFDQIMGGIDTGIQTAASLAGGLVKDTGEEKELLNAGKKLDKSAQKGAKNILGDTTSLFDVGTKSLGGNNKSLGSNNLLSGISLGNEDYLAQAGSALKNFAPNDYKPLQAKIKTKNSLYNYNTLLTV